MGSALSWLDVSAEQQRRVRDIIRLFEEPGTRDELGIGPIRDSFSDLLFPGTSTLQTRARYFLFIPWIFKAAENRGKRGQALLDAVDRGERQLIERFKAAGFVDGLIGRLAGARVKYLPSNQYWSGLDRWGVLQNSLSPRAIAELAGGPGEDERDEIDTRARMAWHPTLPPAPPGFPNEDSGGFDLTAEEARWLQERILNEPQLAGTLLAHLVGGPELTDSEFLWLEPAVLSAPPDILQIVDHARRFSVLMHGPALVYNLLVAERYERSGFTRVDSPVDRFRDALDDWAAEFSEDEREPWDWQDFWSTVDRSDHRVATGAQVFAQDWLDCVRSVGAQAVAADAGARRLVETRVSRLRGRKAVLSNDKLLAQWGGSSGSTSLNYRWPTVHGLVTDIHEGLARAGT